MSTLVLEDEGLGVREGVRRVSIRGWSETVGPDISEDNSHPYLDSPAYDVGLFSHQTRVDTGTVEQSDRI